MQPKNSFHMPKICNWKIHSLFRVWRRKKCENIANMRREHNVFFKTSSTSSQSSVDAIEHCWIANKADIIDSADMADRADMPTIADIDGKSESITGWLTLTQWQG